VTLRLVQPEPEEKSGADRRRSDRVPYIIDAWLQSPSSPGQRLEVIAVNLSRHGAAFQIDQPLAVGEYHVLEIGLGEKSLICKSVVRRCLDLDNGQYEIGVEFC
jgi:hypothetical protein